MPPLNTKQETSCALKESYSFLAKIEKLGNKLPNPTFLFICLCGFVLVVSALSSLAGIDATHPITGDTIKAKNLLSAEGLRYILENTVNNFIRFAPVGTALVAVMGIGIADHSGLLSTALRATVMNSPRVLLTFTVVMAGILSNLAQDTGYVIIIPLAALIFKSVGRHPLAGIAAAFAGVSGGYSANFLIGPIDAILAGISSESTSLVDPSYTVSAAGNYYFLLVSTLLIAIIGTWITEKITCKHFPDTIDKNSQIEPMGHNEKSGLKAVGLFTLMFTALILIAVLPDNAVLVGYGDDGKANSIIDSAFIKGIVTIIALYAALAGIIYGRVSKRYTKVDDFVLGMDESMATMASYLVLMFFAAQFVNYFSWSQIGSILAIKGADVISYLDLEKSTLLICFILFSAILNLFIGSSSAKWALIAPVFVPIFFLAGISPEATQIAYRIGDSSTNIITPLMPYFGVVVAFAQQHKKDLGVGTIMSMMLPYSVAFLVFWTLLLLFWLLFGWDLGPGASAYL